MMRRRRRCPRTERFRALFEPRGVLVAGASTHPGKFGFVSLHNILAVRLRGQGLRHQPRRRRGARRPDASPTSTTCPTARPTSSSCAPRRRPTPTCCGRAPRRASPPPSSPRPATARRGSEGRRGPGRAGRPRRRAGHPARRPQRPGRRLDPGEAVRPDRRRRTRRRAASASPASRATSSARSRTTPSSPASASAGPCRPATPPPSACPTTSSTTPTTPQTAVGLAYVEGVADGRAFFERLRRRRRAQARRRGQGRGHRRRAAGRGQPHRLAGQRRPGVRRRRAARPACRAGRHRRGGASRPPPPSPPSRCPAGNRVVVVTTAGGWGVVTADAIAGTDLELAAAARRPAGRDRRQAAAPVEPQQPGRPGRRRDPDTVPECSSWRPTHPEVDAVIFLGMGIQSNQAQLMREGRFYPDHGLERIVGFHERQDARYAEAAAEISDATRQAGAGGHRAGRDVARQPRPGRGAGHRPALLPVGQPGRRRARPPVAARPLARAARPGVSDRSDEGPRHLAGRPRAGGPRRPEPSLGPSRAPGPAEPVRRGPAGDAPVRESAASTAPVRGGPSVRAPAARGAGASAGRSRPLALVAVGRGRRGRPVGRRGAPPWGRRGRRHAGAVGPAGPGGHRRAGRPTGGSTPTCRPGWRARRPTPAWSWPPRAATVFEHNPAPPVTGASTQKLLTATGLLLALRPRRHVHAPTAVAAAAPQGGVVAGDLFLVGGGAGRPGHRRVAPMRARHPPAGGPRRRRAGRGHRGRRASPASTAAWSATAAATTTSATSPRSPRASSTRTRSAPSAA